MKSEEKLYLAIGEIDDQLIAEASVPYKKGAPIGKIIAIAASAAIVTVAVAAGAGLFDAGIKSDMANDAAPPPEDSNMDQEAAPGSSNIIESDIGILIPNYSTKNSYTFKLIIIAPTELPLDVYLYSQDKSALYTTASVTDEDIQLYKVKVTVDGEEAERLPGEIGEYDITITFPNLDESGIEWSNYFTIDNFGPIKPDIDFN